MIGGIDTAPFGFFAARAISVAMSISTVESSRLWRLHVVAAWHLNDRRSEQTMNVVRLVRGADRGPRRCFGHARRSAMLVVMRYGNSPLGKRAADVDRDQAVF
jgi:hypothetical protein